MDFLTSDQTLWSVVILAFASLIQATVGFAAALFGLPLLLWAGNDLMESQILIFTAMMPQNLYSVWKLRKSIDYREVIGPAAIRIAGMPIGVAGLVVVLSWSAASVNRFVGIIILVAVALQTLVGIEWKSAKRWYWILITFGGSGVLQGLSGASGPPLVLWVHGQRYKADRARAFLFAMYSSNFVPQLLLLWLRFGNTVWQPVGTALLALPLVIIGASIGLRAGSRLGDKWLRPVSYACLVCLATISLLDGLLW